jgi:CRP-like cAMP-binding protein
MRPTLDKASVLRAVPLFARLGPDELLALAELAESTTLAAGARLFTEGDPGDALYLVVAGRVAVDRGGVRVAELGLGECIGELAIIDEGQRSATVTALEPAELLRLDRDDFLDTLFLYPAVARAVLAVLARRLRGTDAAPPRSGTARTVAWES